MPEGEKASRRKKRHSNSSAIKSKLENSHAFPPVSAFNCSCCLSFTTNKESVPNQDGFSEKSPSEKSSIIWHKQRYGVIHNNADSSINIFTFILYLVKSFLLLLHKSIVKNIQSAQF